jgi:hypothetical protein
MSHFSYMMKYIYRLIRYHNQRKKFVREIGIKKTQDRKLRAQYSSHQKKLIVFIVPGADWATGADKISGGTISIVSLSEESAQLESTHGAAVIMCTLPEAHIFLNHTTFENHTDVFRFDQLPSYFRQLTFLMIHLPEFLVSEMHRVVSKSAMKWFEAIPNFRINVMNQNIQLMPPTASLRSLEQYGANLSITTAHANYCNMANRKKYGVPLHKFSVWISPEQYSFKQYEEKENLIVVSPDPHPAKEAIMNVLENISDLKVQIIRNLTYSKYKELVSRAKWALTFGEGLDGYFIEPVFSGAVAFAVYNDEFFTPDFSDLETVYATMDALEKRISNDIASLNNNAQFNIYQKKQFDLCAKYYSKEQYKKNIAAFYDGQYTLA